MTLAALVFTGGAAAQTVTETEVVDFPFTTALYNTCASELVLVVGTMHVQTHITAQGGRLFYETSTWSKDARAQSTLTGARYVYNNEFRDVLHASFEKDNFVSTQRVVINLIRLGEDGKLLGDDDLFVHCYYDHSDGDVHGRPDGT